MTAFTSETVTPWLLRILADFGGQFRIDDRIFEADSVHGVGSRGTFTITLEEWAGHDLGRLEAKLREWASLAL